MLSEAIEVADLETDYTKLLIYGANRVGKTTLACQFPKPLLLVSFEPAGGGGATSVKRVPGIKFLHLKDTEKAGRLARELLASCPFKSVVFDGVTSYQDLVLRELMGWTELKEQLDWGSVPQDKYRERAEKTKEGMRPWLSLPCDTVILAKEKDHNPPKEERNKLTRGLQLESFIAADVGGATAGWLNDNCDIVRLYHAKETKVKQTKVKIAGKESIRTEEYETGKIVRRLLTQYHPNFAAGLRSENPGSVPEYIEGTTPEDMYRKLLAVIRGDSAGK